MFALRSSFRTTTTLLPSTYRYFSASKITMGVEKTITSPGNGVDKPKAGDNVTMHYVGKLDNGKVYVHA